MAASLCRKHNINPRSIYRYHLNELKTLMREGIGSKNLPNNQKYNEGESLSEQPQKQIFKQ
jgi:hypothetical protein